MVAAAKLRTPWMSVVGLVFGWLFCFLFDHSEIPFNSNPTVPFLLIRDMATYGNTNEWQASPPRNQETPLQSLNNLRSLLHNPPESLQSQLPDSFPYVQGLMDGVLQGIMEEAQTMTRTLGTVYAEYRLHYGDSCEYVGIWKCTMLPHQPKKENIMNGKR